MKSKILSILKLQAITRSSRAASGFYGASLGLIAILLLANFGQASTLTNPKAPAEFAEKHYFNQSREFPNLFLPPEYRNLPLDHVPLPIVQETRTALEAAIQSLHQRMEWSVFLPGKSGLQTEKLLPMLVEQTRKIEPGAKLYSSGGLLRSMLSYLYREMHLASQNNPGFDGLKFLQEFSKNPSPISDSVVRGVGSDLDLLIDQAGERSESIKSSLLKTLNYGMNTYFGSESPRVSADRLSLIRTVFTQGDIKDYGPQIARSSAEGGSTLDWLAFDLETGKFREPSRDPHIIDHFIQGRFTYLLPTRQISPEEHAGTVLRGIRPMLELPHLQVHGESDFSSEVQAQIAWMKEKKSAPSGHDLMQIKKMSRNSIEGSAQNRLYRARPNTLDSTASTWLKMIQDKTKVKLPIMAYQEIIEGRLAPQKDLPKAAFISTEKFLEKYTDHGYLYHGTSSPEAMLSILRGGFQISRDHVQGVSSFGSGVYTTPDFKTANGTSYSKGNAEQVLKLKVKNNPELRVLNWRLANELPEIKKIVNWCEQRGVDPFEYLSREYHIDAIINTHVIVQNNQIFDPDQSEELLKEIRARYANVEKEKNEKLWALIRQEHPGDFQLASLSHQLLELDSLSLETETELIKVLEKAEKGSQAHKETAKIILKFLALNERLHSPALDDVLVKLVRKSQGDGSSYGLQAIQALIKSTQDTPEIRLLAFTSLKVRFIQTTSFTILSQIFILGRILRERTPKNRFFSEQH